MTTTADSSSVKRYEHTFEPGTGCLSADDLDNPDLEAIWVAGRYQIIEGVLTRMAPAYFTGGGSLIELIVLLHAYFASQNTQVRFANEAELVLGERRVLRADAAMMTRDDRQRQNDAAKKLGRKNLERTRLLVPPTLVIESISPGHEYEDMELKWRMYAEFGVPNYWVINAFTRSLICHRLLDAQYVIDCQGRESDEIKPNAFPNLVILLGTLWETPAVN